MTHVSDEVKRQLRSAPNAFARIVDRIVGERKSSEVDLSKTELRVSVLSGRHRGAVAVVNGQSVVVGASANADVVLCDEGIADEHFRARIRRYWWCSQLELQALNGSIVAGYNVPDESGALTVDLPVDVAMDSTRVRFEDMRPKDELWPTGRGLATAIFIGAALGLLLSFAPMDSSLGSGSWPSTAFFQTSKSMSLDRLLPRLGEAGLLGKVHVSQRSGAFVFRGTLPADDYKKWRALRGQLSADGLAQSATVDLVGVATGARVNQKLVSAVLLKPEPRVVAYNGNAAGVGEVLVDGWVVKEIGRDLVVLMRGQQTVKVNW